VKLLRLATISKEAAVIQAVTRPVLLLAAALLVLVPVWANTPKTGGVPADEALARLKAGNARFVADQLAPRATFPDQRSRLAKGQKPFAVIVTCADSRVAPELVFNQQLGELFVIRVAGNVADPVVLGSIEYAVEHLGCKLVVIMGHTKCGAVKAVVEKEHAEGNLLALVKQIDAGKDLPKDKEAAVDAGVRNNVQFQVQQMSKKSSVIRDYAKSERIALQGAVYSLETGTVEWVK
jgi:carbonic anhydrase